MHGTRCLAAALLPLLAACGSSTAGGRGGGTGGAGGTGVPEAPDGITAPVPVELSFLSFAIATQVWSPTVGSVPSTPGLRLVLQEDAGGCALQEGRQLGPTPHAFTVSLRRPAVGDCPAVPWYEATGCSSSVTLELGTGRAIAPWMLLPTAATVRLDRIDERAIAGELRAAFPRDPEVQSTWDGRPYCTGISGAMRECEVPGEDCCNAGKPLEEVSIPFEAAFCVAASGCGGPGHCAALEAAAACPIPAVDCEASCEGFPSACVSCYAAGCEGDSLCEESAAELCSWMAGPCAADCPAEARLPLASVALACLAAPTDTCEDWLSCLESCGGTR